jgi:hypothetical protein
MIKRSALIAANSSHYDLHDSVGTDVNDGTLRQIMAKYFIEIKSKDGFGTVGLAPRYNVLLYDLYPRAYPLQFVLTWCGGLGYAVVTVFGSRVSLNHMLDGSRSARLTICYAACKRFGIALTRATIAVYNTPIDEACENVVYRTLYSIGRMG